MARASEYNDKITATLYIVPNTNSDSLPEKQEIHERTNSFIFNRAMVAVDAPSGLTRRRWLTLRPRRSCETVTFALVMVAMT